jgi:hypothetical protein
MTYSEGLLKRLASSKVVTIFFYTGVFIFSFSFFNWLLIKLFWPSYPFPMNCLVLPNVTGPISCPPQNQGTLIVVLAIVFSLALVLAPHLYKNKKRG